MSSQPRNLVKHPRMLHLPWSEGSSRDDLILDGVQHFCDKQVVVTVKLDGENTTLYRDFMHARSIDSSFHFARSWVKNMHSKISYKIPVGWRICGENMYAKHLISYQNLASYFYVHSIWDENNVCLGWEETCRWCELLGLVIAPVIYVGKWDEEMVRQICPESFGGDPCEGIVVRQAIRFAFEEYSLSVAKYVKKEFAAQIQGSSHWSSGQIVVNGLKIK